MATTTDDTLTTEQTWRLTSGEEISLSSDTTGVELVSAAEPDGAHLVLSWGDVTELVIRLSDLLHERLR